MSKDTDVELSLKMLYSAQIACPNITFMINHPNYKNLTMHWKRMVEMAQWSCIAWSVNPDAAKCLPDLKEIDHVFLQQDHQSGTSTSDQHERIDNLIRKLDTCLTKHSNQITPALKRAYEISPTKAKDVYLKPDLNNNVILPTKANPLLQINESDNDDSASDKIKNLTTGDCKPFLDEQVKVLEADIHRDLNMYVQRKKMKYCLMSRLCNKQIQSCLEGPISTFESCVSRGEVADCIEFDL
ncbi:hypothetical protein AKO1_006203 [Acrasis kona]|uniref:Uncharacterized protein n=1 Tax=Acrasis kona TaxID=1008807 RepID=A0AAW2YI70_9EUKA